MLASSLPSKIQLPFANTGTKNTIPVPSQIGITPGAASYTDGFPPLTFTPLASGGIPPDGADVNGILNAVTAVQQWQSAGGIFKFDSAFSTAIGGYPAGAILLSTDGITRWLNLVDNNTADPDGGSAGGTWLSLNAENGLTDVTGLAGTNVTLTSTQYKNAIITLAGTLTANIQIIFPVTKRKWIIINNTTGNFTITAKTSGGTGVIINQGSANAVYGDGTNIVDTQFVTATSIPQISPVSASVAANALTVGYGPASLTFRNATASDGSVQNVKAGTALSLTVPSGATLGTVSGNAERLILLVLNNVGVAELAIVNESGGVNLDESGVISTTAISGTSNSNNVIYSTAARSNVAYRKVGYVEITEATAGTWATGPTKVQGIGGQAGVNGQTIGIGQTYQIVTGSRTSGVTYYNTTGKPIFVTISASTSTAGSLSPTVSGVALPVVAIVAGTAMGTSFIVPPEFSYSVVIAGTVTGTTWVELR